MLRGIHDFFTKKEIPVIPTPKAQQTFTFGGDWGNRIELFENWPKKEGEPIKIVGWKNPKPKKGDILLMKMRSGSTLKCKFTTVKYCGDPADMFFADLEPIEYLDN